MFHRAHRARCLSVLALGLVLVAAACGPRAATPVAAPTAAVTLEVDELVRRSNEALDAFDANDAAKLEQLMAREFGLFTGMRFYDRAHMLRRAAARREAGYPRVQASVRTDERVRRFPTAAVYAAYRTDSVEPRAGAAASTIESEVHLFWVVEDGVWKLAHLGIEPGGIDAERAKWNGVFRDAVGFETAPNRFLVEVTRDRAPGRALDVGMGQGRNTLYLASRGWTVTGVDIADEGIRQAREVAARESLTLETVAADLATWDWGTARWDLIAMIYMGGREHVDNIKRSLAPGGIVVFEYFHDDGIEKTNLGGFKTGELATLFAGFTILRDEVVEDVADYGLRTFKLVRFVAQKP